MARRDRRRSEREQARQRRKIDREVAAGGDGPPHFIAPRSVGDILTDMEPGGFSADAVRAAVEARQANLAGGPDPRVAQRRRLLIEAIPEHLRDTPEARLLVSRMMASWRAPVRPAQRDAWIAEWEAFLASQPEAIVQRANAAGLIAPERPQVGLWKPGTA